MFNYKDLRLGIDTSPPKPEPEPEDESDDN
jgi:hypothetical protein